MEFIHSGFEELHITELGGSNGGVGRPWPPANHPNKVDKSKNLQAERRRQQKLSNRLLALRGLVPIITNMNKATVIEDAINYIKELQKNVRDLSEQLVELETSSEEEAEPRGADHGHEIDAAEEMKKHEIRAGVEEIRIDENKLCVKMIFQNKRGGLSKLMEGIRLLGLEFTDTSVTTSKGAILVSSCVQGMYGAKLEAQHTRELLQEIIGGI
ncbi:transcription factor DYT1-like [Malania oleifera]|uniref:transcription factor DYT1-like n=1 Tax=Malania oleifera TaxID=397392 RepID=UPI0025ADD1D0|nr:transcription factor DYT1-like [Malania oleifera]